LTNLKLTIERTKLFESRETAGPGPATALILSPVPLVINLHLH